MFVYSGCYSSGSFGRRIVKNILEFYVSQFQNIYGNPIEHATLVQRLHSVIQTSRVHWDVLG